MNKRLLLTAFATAALLATSAQTTTRRGLKSNASKASATEKTATPVDTIVNPEAHTVDINGYDKPLRSRRETFFVTNNSKKEVAAIAVTLTYSDKAGRQLHQQKKNVDVEIPAGETRQVSIPSWDKQQSFYYVRSTVPTRTDNVSSFDVTINVDSLFVK